MCRVVRDTCQHFISWNLPSLTRYRGIIQKARAMIWALYVIHVQNRDVWWSNGPTVTIRLSSRFIVQRPFSRPRSSTNRKSGLDSNMYSLCDVPFGGVKTRVEYPKCGKNAPLPNTDCMKGCRLGRGQLKFDSCQIRFLFLGNISNFHRRKGGVSYVNRPKVVDCLRSKRVVDRARTFSLQK